MRKVVPASLVAVGASVLALACAHASSASRDAKASEQRTVVTGSRISRQRDSKGSCFPDTASPVVIYPREALPPGGAFGNLAIALQHANPATPCSPPDRADHADQK